MNPQYTFESSEFAHFVDTRIRWLQAQLSHIQAMKSLLREKKKRSPKPAVPNQKRRSDDHCHQVSWALQKASKKFAHHQSRRRRRAAARVPLTWTPATFTTLSESPVRSGCAARTSLRAY
ncbi:uncharacterized protein ACA1_097810 [Acanthamoeba castellanii str. Neff]|uniref:Uncharacterized protein n=1 Tax=Acanthamoeba castellanii (strain ATCC 30010 / Neff) TaxID=1257118 RepID=L8GJW7_ACACF|nr:uncharacterized protein ACA1_097810 [Acanthamoeba castellanii str. Neff]ELR13094.1 hypothetical protein ACA1_097810 [Acanthamoeba castellanii str. Neff]